jgi:hypothetical protein
VGLGLTNRLIRIAAYVGNAGFDLLGSVGKCRKDGIVKMVIFVLI